MAITLQVDTSLDVISKQKELVREALGADSVYVRTKETLVSLMKDGTLKDPVKAEILANVLGTMTASITTASMNTALQWEAQEKELAFKKKELEYQLDILDQERMVKEHQVGDMEASKQLKQAQRIRVYGTAITDAEGNVVSLNDDGKEYAVIQNTQQDTANKALLNEQIQAQTDEVQARTHRTIADTYVNHGIYTWTNIGSNGVTGVVPEATGYTTLSDLQKEVAVEQAKGYVYNAWATAASSSSGMIGTLVAAEIPDLDPTGYLNTWNTVVSNLKNLTPPNISI